MRNNEIIKKDEIDLVELVNVFWTKRKFILKIGAISFILGVIIALTSKVEYEASCELLPESSDANVPDFGGLSGLAGLAGVDLSAMSGGGGLSPDLFPEIVSSAPFLDSLIHTPVYFEKLDTTISSKFYFEEVSRPSLTQVLLEYTLGLPGKLKRALKSTEETNSRKINPYKRYSKDEWELLERFSGRISVSMNDETGIISVVSMMPDPIAAAMITDLVVERLTKALIDYKIGKAKASYEFISEQFENAKTKYETKQTSVARFVNQNKNISNSLIEAEYERLQNELDIAFEVYKGLASQLEQVKIKLEEETPVFTIFEPVRVPEEKSKPRRGLITVGFTIAGMFISLIIIVFPYFLDYLKK